MRQFSIVLCATALVSGYASVSAASPLVFSLDLTAPCTQGSCSGTHPTDMGFVLGASQFDYSSNNGAFVSTLALSAPVVCDEVANGGALGPVTTQRLAPAFTNAPPGGLLEFNGGGPTVIDIGAFTYDGSTPAGVAATYSNYGATLPPQVACYQINPITGGPQTFAAGPSGIFASSFEDHPAEPWLSVQTVVSPRANVSKKLVAAPTQGANSQITGVTPPDTMAYVVEVHNATAAVGWHLVTGYDYAFFDPITTSRHASTLWCVLGNAVPQPGTISGSPASCGSAGTSHVFANADIQSGTNSIFVYVEYEASQAAIDGWNTLSAGLYPAVAAIFPPFGKYAQRFDDKVVVASGNNRPTFNIGNIACNNDASATACVLRDQDGNPVPTSLKFQNTISAAGAAVIDPLVYVVDPLSNTTLPGNLAADALTPTNVSCRDPNGILAGGISGSNFSTSPSALGGRALSFNFMPSGSPDFPFVAGTANCTATFSASGYAPGLSRTGTFSVTMQQAAVASIALTANASQTAAPGGNVGYTLHVANAGNAALSNVGVSNPLGANVASLSWTCTPAGGASCPAASGSGAISQTVGSLPVGGSLNYAITTTLVGAASFVSAAQVSDAASITVPGGSCSGGSCNSSANVATVPLIHLTLAENPTSYANSGDTVTYTITVANEGGTDASGLTVTNPGVAGLTFTAWTCTATGTNSSCPNPAGVGAINETAIAIAAGGNVVYSLSGAVTVSSGNITDTVTVGPGGTVCVGNVCSAQQILTGP